MVFYFSCYSKNIDTFGGTNPGCRVALEPKTFTAAPNTGIFESYVMELAPCHPSGAWNFEVTSRFLENLLLVNTCV
jgi:hypothetical protein